MSPDAHHHPPFCVTAHLLAATSSLANDDDNEPNPQCHVTMNGTSEEVTEGGWEGIQAEGGDTGRGGGAGEQQWHRRSLNFLLTMGGGMCNPHTAPFPLIYPPIIGGGSLMMGVAYHLHTAPHLTSFTPPHWGGFFPASLTTTGQRVIHTPPHSIFFPSPLLGELLSQGQRGGM